MTRTRADLLTVAGRLTLIGGGLGIVAGAVQVAVGSRIPDWSGDKDHPVALGLLTVALSLSALASARALIATTTRPDPGIVRVTVWLAIVAVVCSTTVGRLWLLPGSLLLAAAGVTLAAGGWHRFRTEVTTHWLRGLLAILGAAELMMAVSAAPALTIVTGFLGGVALIAAALLAGPGRQRVVGGLVVATLPFAIVAWWAVIPPLLSVVAFAIGVATTRIEPLDLRDERSPDLQVVA